MPKKSTLLNILGAIASATGRLSGASKEQRRFLKAGWKCPQCDARLLTAIGNETTNYYAKDGRRWKPWSVFAGGSLIEDIAECPKCGHRWNVYRTASATPPGQSATGTITND